MGQSWHLPTQAIHSGHQIDESTGAVSQPIVLSTTFERGSDGEFLLGRDIYARASNPNRRSLEIKLSTLEGGTECITFASGQAATLAVFHSLKTGDHVIIPDDIYYGTKVLLQNHFSKWGLEYTVVDMTNLDLLSKAIKPNTALIWIETPSNPALKITDLNEVVSLAKPKGILTACDNTWASSFFCKPLDLGIDFVMHSTTKYFGGHSDITGGCIITRENNEQTKVIRDFQILGGGVPSPFDCWLLNRSLATYPMRMKAHGENAMILAQYLSHHSKIEKVNYPGLKTNEYHVIAEKQMINGYGGMMSILVKGGPANTLKLASTLKIITHATSLGGVESLVDHRHSAEGVHSVSPENLLRISVGVEHADDLIKDLEQALNQI